MLNYCEKMIKEGKAYVDDTDAEVSMSIFGQDIELWFGFEIYVQYKKW